MKGLIALLLACCATTALAQNASQFPFPPQTSGGSSTPCTTTQSSFQFNNGGAFGCVSTWTSDGTSAFIVLGTMTASNFEALNITGTFSSSTVVFDAPIFMNIVNTASANGSAFQDWQVGGVSKMAFGTAQGGNFLLAFGGLTASHPSIRDDGGTALGVVLGDASAYAPLTAATVTAQTGSLISSGSPPTVYLNGSAARIQFGNSADPTLVRQGANNLGITNGGNATTLRIYNTSDVEAAPNNYERGVMDWGTQANTFTIGTQNLGTGSKRSINITPASYTLTLSAHVTGGNPPSAGNCAGFSAGTSSSDLGGTATFTGNTTCTVSFSTAYAHAPGCVVSPGFSAVATQVTTTTTNFAITFSSAQSSFTWNCIGA